MDLDLALQTFILESRELLEDMENALLNAEQAGGEESVHAIFRAAHTIKGSAGLFGLDHIVAFTHVVESLLDDVRDGKLAMTDELVVLLLSCCDHLSAIINAVDAGQTEPDPEMEAAGAPLVTQLRAHMGVTDAAMARRQPARWWRNRPTLASSVSVNRAAVPAMRGICRCASGPMCCATAWTRCRSSVTWARLAASSALSP